MRATALRARDDGYSRADFRAKLSPEAYRSAVPAAATAKGFYFQAFVDEARSMGVHLSGFGPYRDFKDYPQAEGISVLVECAQRMYPDETLREGLRRLGWSVFPTLLGTMIGGVVFGALGADMPTVVKAAPRGFEVSISHSKAEVLSVSAHEAELRVSNFYLFVDCFMVGILEGSLAHYGLDGDVRIKSETLTSATFHTRW